jgi:hypothetical protein
VPSVLRTKLEAHATPAVFLGVDTASRSYLLGSLYDLHTSVAVEVTFLENAFPFRKFKASDSPASLLWGADASLSKGDPRLGMFDTQVDETVKTLDRNALKSIGALPDNYSAHVEPAIVPTSLTPPVSDLELKEDANDENEVTPEMQLRRSSRVVVAPVRTNQRYRERPTTPTPLLPLSAPL